jgi:hypothetical protein
MIDLMGRSNIRYDSDWLVRPFCKPYEASRFFLAPQKTEPSCDNLGNIPSGVRKPPAERQEQILDAGTALFAASGYRMTDTQDIAGRVKGGFP